MFDVQPASGVELEKEQETGPRTAVFQARSRYFFLPDFHGIPAPLQNLFHQEITQAETSRHCKTCEQTVRCHTTAATPWASPHLPLPARHSSCPQYISPALGPAVLGSTNFTHHQLHLHQGHSGKLPSGFVGSGMRAGAPGRALPCTSEQRGGFGCSWVLAERRRAAASLGKVFTAHSRLCRGHCLLLPAQHLPAEPRGTGMGASTWGCASTNRLVEEGTERVKVQCDLLGAEYTEMLRLTQHRIPKCLAKH